jgi:hypothetical protein
MKTDDWDKARPIPDAYSRINTLLQKTVYSDADKKEILKLLRKLGLGGDDEGRRYPRLRQNRAGSQAQREQARDRRQRWCRLDRLGSS